MPWAGDNRKNTVSVLVGILIAVLIICPLFLAVTPGSSRAEGTLNVMSSRLQLLNLRLKGASVSPDIHTRETTRPSTGKDMETSAEVRIPLTEKLRAFFCLQEDNTGNLVSGENNQNFRALMGFNVAL